MSEEVLATAAELREATDKANSALVIDTRSFQEKNTEWLQWFSKRGVRIFKDAIQFGKYNITVDIPYQPDNKDAEKSLVDLRKRLRPMIPGCSIHYIEEVYEGQMFCTMLIGWGEEKVAS
jgi:hypothetical protein